MYTGDEVECLADAQPTGQYCDVRNETDILHEFVSLGARVASKHAQFALELRKAKNGFE
jgi:hypothetical protein